MLNRKPAALRPGGRPDSQPRRVRMGRRGLLGFLDDLRTRVKPTRGVLACLRRHPKAARRLRGKPGIIARSGAARGQLRPCGTVRGRSPTLATRRRRGAPIVGSGARFQWPRQKYQALETDWRAPSEASCDADLAPTRRGTTSTTPFNPGVPSCSSFPSPAAPLSVRPSFRPPVRRRVRPASSRSPPPTTRAGAPPRHRRQRIRRRLRRHARRAGREPRRRQGVHRRPPREHRRRGAHAPKPPAAATGRRRGHAPPSA